MKPEHLPRSILSLLKWGYIIATIWTALPWISLLLIKNYKVESHADPVAYLIVILHMVSFNVVLFFRDGGYGPGALGESDWYVVASIVNFWTGLAVLFVDHLSRRKSG